MFEYYGLPWAQIGIRLIAAIAVGTAIGIEREHRSRPAGMRTHVLVCVGACLVSLMESCFVNYSAGINFNFGRIAAQVVSGIGFLGAGTILTSKHKITGLTTAASVWNAACLGLACGYGLYAIAICGCATIMLILLLMQRIVHVNAIKRVEIQFTNHTETARRIRAYFRKQRILVLDVDYYVETHELGSLCTYIYELRLPSKVRYTDVVEHLSELEHIQRIRTTDAS